MQRSHTRLIPTIIAVLSIASCTHPSSDSTQLVAQAGPVSLTTADILTDLAAQAPFVRERFNRSLEEKKRYVQRLVRDRLLLAEAERRGLGKDPELQRRYRLMLVTRLGEILRNEIKPESITDEEIAAQYEKDRATYEQTARPRVSQILVGTRKEAESLRREISSAKDPMTRFRELSLQRSLDPRSRRRDGDLGFLDERDPRTPKPILTAARALQKRLDLSPPVEVEGKWALLIKTAELPAVHRPLEQASPYLRTKLLAERQSRATESLVERLQGGREPEITAEALESLTASEEKQPAHAAAH